MAEQKPSTTFQDIMNHLFNLALQTNYENCTQTAKEFSAYCQNAIKELNSASSSTSTALMTTAFTRWLQAIVSHLDELQSLPPILLKSFFEVFSQYSDRSTYYKGSNTPVKAMHNFFVHLIDFQLTRIQVVGSNKPTNFETMQLLLQGLHSLIWSLFKNNIIYDADPRSQQLYQPCLTAILSIIKQLQATGISATQKAEILKTLGAIHISPNTSLASITSQLQEITTKFADEKKVAESEKKEIIKT